MGNIDLSPMAFESMFLLAFAAVALFTGIFTAYFGVKKSRAVGIILILIGVCVLVAFYYFIWLSESKSLIAITGSAVFGAFIGFLVAVGVFLLVIMKSEPSEKKVDVEVVVETKEEAPPVGAEEEAKPTEEVKEEVKEEEPAPPVETEEKPVEEVKEDLPTPLPEEEAKPTEEVKEEVKEEEPAPPVETEEKPVEEEEEEAEEETEKKRKGGRKKGGKKKGRR